MSKSNALENAYLLNLFNNTPFAGIGDAAGLLGSAVAGSLYVSLHTADPGEAGIQTTSEAAYTGYARAAVARSGAGWVVTANSVSPAAVIAFAVGTAGGETCPYFGVGADLSGAGILLYSGLIAVPIVTGNTIIPRLGTGTAITED